MSTNQNQVLPEQLINLGVTLEQWLPVHHLSVDSSDAPDINGTGVLDKSENEINRC